MADLSTLSDDQLQAIADGKMDTLPDDVLTQIAGEDSAPAPAPESPRSLADNVFPLPTAFGTINVNPVRLGHAVKNMGLEGGGATIGQVVGAPFAAVGGVQIGGGAGAAIGNTVAQLTTPGKKFSLGEVGGAAVTGMIPGASLAKAPIKEVAKQAGKYALGNVAAKNVESFVDTGKAASPGEDALAALTGAASAPLSKFLDGGTRAEATRVATQKGAYNRETLKLGRELGYTLPPSVVAPNAVNDTLTSLGGKAAVAQSAIHINQPKTNEAVAKQIGIPFDAPASPISINTARVGPNLVYDKVAKAVPGSSKLLEAYKQANADTSKLFTAYRASLVKDPAMLAEAKAKQAIADAYETQLRKVVGPNLADELKDARRKLAEIGVAERAFVGGDFSGEVIGDAFENGEKLSGNLYKIGRFENRFGKYIREASKTPAAGVDHLKLLAKGAMVGGGAATGNPALAIGAPLAMAAAERGARAGVLSAPYQNALVNQNYGAATADTVSELARFGTMSEGRDLLDEPLTPEEQTRLEDLRRRLKSK